MSVTDLTRDATATIQGYVFQFDSTILSLCNLPPGSSLDVEGIEDFDVIKADMAELFQCKYYEATRLTPATLRDAVLPMLKGFLKLNSTERHGRRFHLYGYFKDSIPGDSQVTLTQLQQALTRRETISTSSHSRYREVNIQDELGATDTELQQFADQLTIHITGKAADHRQKTIDTLRRTCSVSSPEAQLYVYPSARTLVSTIACEADIAKRRISRTDFISQIFPSRAVFNHWMLREQGEQAFCRAMRHEYFSDRNVDAVHRAFIVDASLLATDAECLALCHTLRHKWSSHQVRRKPDAERYAPMVIFRDLPSSRLIALKCALQNDGACFVDGYPFLGAPFSPEHALRPQTFENKLSLRILASIEELSRVFTSIRGEKVAFDFYRIDPTEAIEKCKWVSLPATNVSLIQNII
jgi:hypothetical protein